MVCPKCGSTQADTVECARCGVVVARYRQRPAAGATATTGAAHDARTPVRLSLVLIALTLATVAIVVSRRPAATPPPAFTATPPVAIEALPLEPQPPPMREESHPAPVAEPLPSAYPQATEALPTATCPLTARRLGPAPERGLVSPGWHEGGGDFERARLEQDSTAAPLFVYFRTDWCPYCKALEADFLSNRAIDEYLRGRVVKAKINPESDSASREVARQLGVNSYPSLFVVTPGGAPERISPYDRGTSFKAPAEFIESVEARMSRQVRVLLGRGQSLRRAGRAHEAVDALDRAARMTTEDPQLYLERGLAHAEDASTDEALDDLARVAALRPQDPTPLAVADQLLGRAGRGNEAIGCWTSFLDQNPTNGIAHLARARALAAIGLPGLSDADAGRACALGVIEACARDGWGRPVLSLAARP